MTERDVVYATIERMSGHVARLTFEELEPSGQSISIPMALLPHGVKAGDRVVVEFLTAESSANQRDVTARKLLEDILNGK